MAPTTASPTDPVDPVDRRIERILLALRSDGGWTEMIEAARTIALPTGAEVVAFHVREWLLGAGGEWLLGTSGPFDEGDGVIDRIFDRVVRPLRSLGTPARCSTVIARPGQVGRAIVRAAAREQAGMIVLGCSRRSALRDALGRGIGWEVRHLADVPVLTVPHRAAPIRPLRVDAEAPTRSAV
jgi:nucleotide-binding universal stress UspA family protein